MQKNLKISILGKNYSISTDEESECVLEAVGVVDALMKDKSERSALQYEGAVAIVVALELAVDLSKKNRLIKQWEDKVAELSRTVDMYQ